MFPLRHPTRLAFLLVLQPLLLMATPSSQVPTEDWSTALRSSLTGMAEELSASLLPWEVPERLFRVQDFGAVGDGETLDTLAIQEAIDTCHAAGGGVVLLASGHFVSGTLELKSNVLLEIAEEAQLLGSTDLRDYPQRLPQSALAQAEGNAISLIYAERATRIGIRGPGVIDGRGQKANFPPREPWGSLEGRPSLIRMVQCRQINLLNLTLKNSASWMQTYMDCEDLLFDGLRVENQANLNNDGLDIMGCRRVIIRNAFINSEDDALCFKGSLPANTEDVLVEDSHFYSSCNALKFGTGSRGDFRRVLIRRVTLGGQDETMPALRRCLASSGISWISADGGTVEDILVSQAHITRTESPLFLRLSNRGRHWGSHTPQGPGALQRLLFEHITGDHNGIRGSIIAGIPQAVIRDVVIRDVSWSVAGSAAPPPSGTDIPEMASDYPDAFKYGQSVPAHGFWLRHASNIHFQNLQIQAETPDARPCLVAEADCSHVTEEGRPLPGLTAAP